MSEELRHMGTPEQARAALVEKARAWRALRQPVTGPAKQIKKIEAADNEGRFQLANAALLWLWHEENASPTTEGRGITPQAAIEECLDRLCKDRDLTDYGRDEILAVLLSPPTCGRG